QTYAVNGYATEATNGTFLNVSVMLPGNKVLVAGNPGSNTSYYIEKYLDTGLRDTTFGTNGLVLVNINANSKDNANSMRVQSDGKIIITGTSDSDASLFGTYWDVFVSRLMPDGSVDTTFGTNGHVKTNLGTNDDEVWEVAVASTGEIFVLAATQNTAVVNKLLKYDNSGVLDTSFGTNGVLDLPVPTDSRFYELIINDQDELFLSGTILNTATNEYDATVMKLDLQGTFITSYGINGVVTITDTLENYTTRDMIFTADGGLLITGAAGNNSIDTQLALYKITANGLLDTTFNTTGVAFFNHGSSNYGVTFAYSIVELPDGSFIAQADIIGSNNYDLLLLNVGVDGTLVNSFGNSGRYILPRSTHQDYNRQVLLQDDGKVIVVGMATDATTRRTMLVRFKDVYTLSSRESFSKTYSVYPNPFLDQVNVEGKVEIGQLTLYNTLGQPVSSILNSNVINTSKLPSGIYFLTIIDVQDSKTVRQLIKE
ncbi:T9SS type A sorting domain-containing protein, partial [Nonlabens ulvanivorans]|uniref:T9SS type A sorting domain-containing protein n=1 Tax=Nonlabens ulvanivorans TaxID=906888 RepID=UPI003266EB66